MVLFAGLDAADDNPLLRDPPLDSFFQKISGPQNSSPRFACDQIHLVVIRMLMGDKNHIRGDVIPFSRIRIYVNYCPIARRHAKTPMSLK